MQSNQYKQIGEHYVLLPPMPTDKREVFFTEEKRDNQFWQRDKIISQFRQIWFDFLPNFTKLYQSATIYNQDGLLISLNEDDSQYIEAMYFQEMTRRKQGVWFMNDGEPTWITGDHYFFLMYARMQRHDGQGLYADYRAFQSDYAMLIHHANSNPHILGVFASKPKKTGITNFHWSGYYLNKATMTKNKNLGYMNIDQTQAAKTFRDYFLYSYNGLISPLKPAYKNKSEVDGTIIFAESYNKKVRGSVNNDNDLNTSVFCVPTEPKAFDVAVMSDITFDEPTKYKKPFGEIWRTNKEAVKIQTKFNGRAWLFNYTPEDNKDSFKEAREVFMDSELKTIKPDSEGQTKSGLIAYHIPAYTAWEGAFDKFGRCDAEKARKQIQRERDKVAGNKNALQSVIRQYANDKREAWGYGGASSIFDPIRLSELELDLEELQRSGPTFKQGNLVWTNPLWEAGKKDKRPKGQFCSVKFVPLTEDELAKGQTGSFRFYEDVPTNFQNEALKYGRDDYGNLKPPPKFRYCSGIDPADFREAGNAEEGSLIAMHCMPIHDEIYNTAMRRPATKIINAEYFYRPDNPEQWYQDIVKFIIYHGCLVLIEANNGTIATRLEAEGLGHYMIFKNEEKVFSLYKANHGGTLTHIRNSKSGNVDTIADIIMYIKSYLLEADSTYGEIDYGKTIKSERLLEQLKKFDSQDTKKFDLVMSFGYCLMCHENYLALCLTSHEDNYQAHEVRSVLSALSRL